MTGRALLQGKGGEDDYKEKQRLFIVSPQLGHLASRIQYNVSIVLRVYHIPITLIVYYYNTSITFIALKEHPGTDHQCTLNREAQQPIPCVGEHSLVPGTVFL